MENKKSLTLNGLVLNNFIFILICIGMIFIGVYLTNHYFHTFYPSGISESSSLCDINQFWGCDKATRSPLGTILGMPTSIFGIIMGIFGLICSFTGAPKFEQTAKTIYMLNFVVCVVLFIYSMIALGSLCPMCTAYYILSAGAAFMFYKFSDFNFGIDPKFGGLFALLVIIPLIGLNVYINGKKETTNKLANSYIQQFNNLKDYGDPATESAYKIHMATPNFSDAPIRISIFSDFQCPYCQAVAEQVPKLISEFKDKINIQYMFYPLDATCNTKMKGGMHPYACQAAYLAACKKEKFVEVHDYIFENQSDINKENLLKWGKMFGLNETCFNDKDIQDHIQQTMNAGDQFQLKSTPTIIINGKKLEGLIPTVHLNAILRSLLK